MIVLLILNIRNRQGNIVKKMQYKYKYNKIITDLEKDRLIFKFINLQIKVYKCMNQEQSDQLLKEGELVYHQNKTIIPIISNHVKV